MVTFESPTTASIWVCFHLAGIVCLGHPISNATSLISRKLLERELSDFHRRWQTVILLITKFIYLNNDVTRNDVIFIYVVRCAMATVFFLGFYVFIFILIIVLLFIQRNQFTVFECKRRLFRISRIAFNVKNAIHSWLVFVMWTFIMFTKQINRFSKGKNAHIST